MVLEEERVREEELTFATPAVAPAVAAVPAVVVVGAAAAAAAVVVVVVAVEGGFACAL